MLPGHLWARPVLRVTKQEPARGLARPRRVPAAPSRLTLNESRTPWGTLSSRTNLCQLRPPITSYFIKIFTFCVLGRSSVTPLGESSKKNDSTGSEPASIACHLPKNLTKLSTVFSILTN